MTNLLEKAFQEVSKLPNINQNIIAKWLLDELESDEKWDKLFAESEDVLEKIASEALKEHELGKTTELDLDKI